MMENKICPICLNEIPIDAIFLCPSCHFELKWLENDKMIEIAKKNFTGRLYTAGDHSKSGPGVDPGKRDDPKHLEYQLAKKVYRWLWWSPLLTIPTLLFLFFFWESVVAAVGGSALWHLTLLKPAQNEESAFIRWHGRQALALAGLRTAIPLFLAVFYELEVFSDLNLDFIPILIAVWFFGNIWGQNQAARGDCSLARWRGHEDELPGPPSVSDQVPKPLSPENQLEALVNTIRFSKDPELRAKALEKLTALGVVEDF